MAAAETSPTLRCGRLVITVDDDDHGILRHVPLIESSWKFAAKKKKRHPPQGEKNQPLPLKKLAQGNEGGKKCLKLD